MDWTFGLGDALAAVASVINTRQTNKTNERLTRETNAANREMVEMQNKAAALEADKAYKRSMPTNQVSNLLASGMSRAGAINTLNDGGSYTPAPVNVAQDTAPQHQTTDFSALANMIQIGANSTKDKVLKSIFDKIANKHEWLSDYQDVVPSLDKLYSVLNDKQRKAMTDPAIRTQVQEFLNESFNGRENIHKQSMWIYETRDAEYNASMHDLDKELRTAIQQETIDAAKQEALARKAASNLERLKNDVTYDALDKMDSELRVKYFETRALLEYLSHASEVSVEKFIGKVRTLLGI